MNGEPLLRVRHLVVGFQTQRGYFRAIDDVSFDVPRAETVCLVGESGSGKTVTSLSLMRLLTSPPARVEAGSVLFEGKDLLTLRERDMRKVRGAQMAMIFQEPMTSLNPVYTVGWQIVEAIRLHQPLSRKAAHARAEELLQRVGIPAPKERLSAYPHELSGGMRQRVMIAMALSCAPRLLIADEPTTALDVTIQAQILDLLRKLKQELQMSVLLITHDLGVVAEVADRVIVMYAGRVVESVRAQELFRRPMHPYTAGLLQSLPPSISEGRRTKKTRRLPTIGGMPPDLLSWTGGCRFSPRCAMAQERCRKEEPELLEVGNERWSRCHFAADVSSPS